MPLILYTGLDEKLSRLLASELDVDLKEFSGKYVSAEDLAAADTVLVGPGSADQIRLAQSISRTDKDITTLILADAEQLPKVKQQALLTPFLSKTISCHALSADLAQRIASAAQQTRQRRKYAKIDATLRASVSAMPKSSRLEYLGTFLDQAPIGAVLLDRKHAVVGINAFARSLFQLQPLHNIRSLHEVWPEKEVERILRALESPGGKRSLELQASEQYFEINFAVAENEFGENLDILLISDVTDRKLENDRIRRILDALPQLAWTANRLGEATYLTAGWYAYTGQDYSEAMGRGWTKAVHPEDLGQLLQDWEASTANAKSFEAEARFRRADGEYRWHLVRATPMLSSGKAVAYWVGTCTDIHDQKTIQSRLGEAVDQKNEELLQVNELLKKSNQHLEEFAFVASHDLKEPLRKIMIFLDAAKGSFSQEEKEQFFQKAIDSALRMRNLIDGILAYSRLNSSESGEMIDMNAVLEIVIADYDILIRQKEAELSISELPEIWGSKVQIMQLFQNLIGNSLKYSENAVQVRISYRTVRKDDIPALQFAPQQNFYEIEVRDTGIGFDEKYKKDVFSLFRRLHTQSTYSGAGIGLALVKKIMENHEGFVDVKSEKNKGTSFLLYFPVPSKT